MNLHTCIIFAFLQIVTSASISAKQDHRVLLISFDGFRYDYLAKAKANKKATPNFDALIKDGVEAEYMKNVFITKTFPNHYTLATGMYEESHGVVSNNMLDPRFPHEEQEFNLSVSNIPGPQTDRWFNNFTTGTDLGPEPIWITNQREGKAKGSKSGVAMWPGMMAKIHGMEAEKRLPFNKETTNEAKIDQVVEWFTSEDPINLGLLYFNEPDHTGHRVGPDSPQILDVIVELDRQVGYLLDKLRNYNMNEKLNIIITSDHGMQQIKNITYLDDAVEPSMYKAYGSTPVLSITADNGVSNEDLYTQLKSVPYITVYRREEIPREYRYTYNERILPILIVADDHWHICQTKTYCDITNGNHGFSNNKNDMHPFFIANGPAFKKGVKAPHFNSVDVYPLICRILGIKEAPNNGSIQTVQTFLIEDDNYFLTITGVTSQAGMSALQIFVMLSIIFAAMVASVCCIATLRHNQRQRPVSPRFNVEEAPSMQGQPRRARRQSPEQKALLTEGNDSSDGEIP